MIMLNTRVRPAVSGDAAQMTRLLNTIIDAGGTTAYQTPFDVDKMRHHCINRPDLVCSHVTISNGQLSGFQYVGWATSSDPMPDGWAVIATFVGLDRGKMGIGQKLFSATRFAAKAAGVQVLDATIRGDNVGGLKYYGGLGFTDYAEIPNLPLADGTPVTRIRKKLMLT
jgi:L-amino acid N-acyltransferase YncA